MGDEKDVKPTVTGDDIDEVEAHVSRMIGQADAALLEEVCGEISLQIPPSAVGNANKLLKLLNRYLNSQTVVGANDEGLSVLKAVAAVVGDGDKKVAPPKVDQASPDNTSSSTVDNTDSKGKKAPGNVVEKPVIGGAGGVLTKPHVPSTSATSSQNPGKYELVKFRDCKIDGPVGGDKSIPLSSLEFQIENQKLLGHTDGAICAAVLRVTAQGKLRTYLELRKDSLTIDFLLETLRNNLSYEDSEALFHEMCGKVQEEGEKLGSYVTEVLVLRDQVLELRKGESSSSDRMFIQKSMLRALSLGIRNNNIRLRLSAILSNPDVTDGEIFKAVNEVVAHEKQRNDKHAGANSASSNKQTNVHSNAVDAGTSAAARMSLENK